MSIDWKRYHMVQAKYWSKRAAGEATWIADMCGELAAVTAEFQPKKWDEIALHPDVWKALETFEKRFAEAMEGIRFAVLQSNEHLEKAKKAATEE